MSASAVPSAGTPPSSAQRRLIGLPNNQTPSESAKLSVVSFCRLLSLEVVLPHLVSNCFGISRPLTDSSR